MAIDDIDNASSTVKSWRSRLILNTKTVAQQNLTSGFVSMLQLSNPGIKKKAEKAEKEKKAAQEQAKQLAELKAEEDAWNEDQWEDEDWQDEDQEDQWDDWEEEAEH